MGREDVASCCFSGQWQEAEGCRRQGNMVDVNCVLPLRAKGRHKTEEKRCALRKNEVASIAEGPVLCERLIALHKKFAGFCRTCAHPQESQANTTRGESKALSGIGTRHSGTDRRFPRGGWLSTFYQQDSRSKHKICCSSCKNLRLSR